MATMKTYRGLLIMTKTDVLAIRKTVLGCCDKYADHKPCDCLEIAHADADWITDQLSEKYRSQQEKVKVITKCSVCGVKCVMAGVSGAMCEACTKVASKSLPVCSSCGENAVGGCEDRAGKLVCIACWANVANNRKLRQHNDLTIVTFQYKDYKGITTVRRCRPIKLWFGSTAWHPIRQWLLEGFDIDRMATRNYAMSGITGPWSNGEGVPL